LQSYFTAEKEHIFSNVAVLIFVFDVKSVEVDTDIETYQNCIANMREYSPDAQIFVLIHKMDLIPQKCYVTLESWLTETMRTQDACRIMIGRIQIKECMYDV